MSVASLNLTNTCLTAGEYLTPQIKVNTSGQITSITASPSDEAAAQAEYDTLLAEYNVLNTSTQGLNDAITTGNADIVTDTTTLTTIQTKVDTDTTSLGTVAGLTPYTFGSTIISSNDVYSAGSAMVCGNGGSIAETFKVLWTGTIPTGAYMFSQNLFSTVTSGSASVMVSDGSTLSIGVATTQDPTNYFYVSKSGKSAYDSDSSVGVNNFSGGGIINIPDEEIQISIYLAVSSTSSPPTIDLTWQLEQYSPMGNNVYYNAFSLFKINSTPFTY